MDLDSYFSLSAIERNHHLKKYSENIEEIDLEFLKSVVTKDEFHKNRQLAARLLAKKNCGTEMILFFFHILKSETNTWTMQRIWFQACHLYQQERDERFLTKDFFCKLHELFLAQKELRAYIAEFLCSESKGTVSPVWKQALPIWVDGVTTDESEVRELSIIGITDYGDNSFQELILKALSAELKKQSLQERFAITNRNSDFSSHAVILAILNFFGTHGDETCVDIVIELSYLKTKLRWTFDFMERKLLRKLDTEVRLRAKEVLKELDLKNSSV